MSALTSATQLRRHQRNDHERRAASARQPCATSRHCGLAGRTNLHTAADYHYRMPMPLALSRAALEKRYVKPGATGRAYREFPDIAQVPAVCVPIRPLPNAVRLRRRLDALLTHLETVLASTIFNVTMIGRNSKISCIRCEHRVRKAVKDNAMAATARCPGCGLGYTLEPNDEGDFDWQPETATTKCATTQCPEELTIYRDQIKPGVAVRCEACGERTLVVLGSRRADVGEGEEKGPTLQVKLT